MKKQLTLGILALLSFGLVSCANNTPSSSVSSTTSQEQTSQPSSVNNDDLSITYIGDAKVGSSITFVSKFQNSPIVDQTAVVYTANPADSMTITGNKADLLKSGDVTVTATYTKDGTTLTKTLTITIEEGVVISTIAEVKTKKAGDVVLIRGVITASAGTSAYISDATGGIYIYNFSYDKDDTAIKNKRFTVGQSVEMCSVVAFHGGAIQLSNYSGGKIANTYAKTIDTEITPKAPTTLNETGIASLDKDLGVGELYSFAATYVSGAPVANVRGTVNFNIGSTKVAMVTNGSSSKMYDPDISDLISTFNSLDLKAGDMVTITSPYMGQYYNVNQFAYYSSGTKMIKKALAISASDNHYVGQTVTLSGSYAGEAATGTTFAITAGSDLATLTGSSLAITGAGDITVEGTYVLDSVTYKKSITITARDLSAVSTVAAAKALEDGEYVTVEGKIVADNGKTSFVVADATGGFFGFVADPNTSDTALTNNKVVSDSTVKITGVISTYNGVKEITVKHSEAGTIPAVIATTATEVTPLATENLADEAGFKAKASAALALTNGGNMYSLTAKFKSLNKATATFTIGATEFFVYYPSEAAATGANLVADSNYNIVGAYQIYSSKVEFVLMVNGCSVVAA